MRLTTSHMVVGGDALARQDTGRIVFVAGGLPGEVLDVQLRTAKKDFATGDVSHVIEPSPDRVEPPCEAWHRGCGGCDWQHVRPDAQLRLKTEVVREALTRTARLADPVVTSGAAIEPWGYRTTIRLARDSTGRLGFRSRRSHDIVTIERCPVAHPRINELLHHLTGAADDGVGNGVGSELLVRVGTDDGPVITSLVDHDGQRTDDGWVFEIADDQRLRVSHGSFFQSSPQAATLLVEAVRRASADVDMESSRVIDAYGGVGLFAATVARNASEVILIESSPSSCADARVNLGHNETGRRTAVVVQSTVEDWVAVPAELVIADPARSGLDRAGVAALAATGARVVVLVSCDAGSLARDCRLLLEYGYTHRGTEVLDVFPNTSHIEAVSRFVSNSKIAAAERNEN